MRQRISEVMRILLQGASLRDVREYAHEQGWSVSLSQLKRYVQQANRQIGKEVDRRNAVRFERHSETLYAILAKASVMGDTRSALACMDRIATLHRLNPPRTGTFSAEIVLSSFQAVDKLVGDLIEDEAAFKTYRDAMRGILTALQATLDRG